jgi:competence protein ComEC
MDIPRLFFKPLIPLALMAEAGCLLGARGFGIGAGWWAVAWGGLMAAVLARKTGWFWAGAALAAGGVYTCLAWQAVQTPEDGISHFMPCADIRIEGALRQWPEADAFGQGWQAEVDCQSIVKGTRRIPVSGAVKIHVPGNCPAWSGGDAVAVRGALEMIPGPGNPGEWNLAEYKRQQGVYGSCRIKQRADVVYLSQASWVRRMGSILHRRWVQSIRRWVPPEEREWVISLVLGDRSGLRRTCQETMAATGMAHLFAVSGMNIGLVLTSLFGIGRLCRVPRKWLWLAGLLSVGVFSAMVGASASIVRAAIMACVSIIGLWSERRADALSALSLSGLVLLAIDPLSGAQPGFQLSFAATAGLIIAAPWLRISAQGWRGWLKQGPALIGLTLAALTAALPLQCFYFYSVTPIGLVTNLLAIPLVTAATDGGLLLGLLGNNFPWLSQGLGILTGWAAGGLALLAQSAEKIPWGRIFIWRGEALWVAGMYAAGIAALWKPTRRPGTVCLLIHLLWYAAMKPEALNPGQTRITFLDLGIGEASLLENSTGEKVLIDTGTEGEFLWRVKNFLAAQGINRLDGLMLSHPDSDHAGGAEVCLKYFRPRQIYYSGSDDRSSERIKQLLGAYTGVRHALIQGANVCLAPDLKFAVLWPPRHYDPALEPKEGGRKRRVIKTGTPGTIRKNSRANNGNSLVAWWDFPGGNALFTGDVDQACEDLWPGLKKCRILKVAHHGSRHASGERFLAQVMPEISVVQSGFFGMHKFPDFNTWERIKRFSGLALDTAQFGAVEVVVASDGSMRWSCWK